MFTYCDYYLNSRYNYIILYCLDSRDLFLGVGLDHLTVIVNEKCFDAALRIVANVTPMFFGCPEKLTQEAR